ncbi:MAG: hypothetical protein LUF27_00065 [Lachnospiraceae bacterium]|nr:hypothetical protein [Lachnospiraceae bacterium]
MNTGYLLPSVPVATTVGNHDADGQNLLENVTEEQLKKLFTGEITEWEELND